MVTKKFLIVIPVVIIVFLVIFSAQPSEKKNNIVFHSTMADLGIYKNGIFTDSFTASRGEYVFRFVPNGSSPEILSITLVGKNLNFHEDFRLKGTAHQTGISEYFTWEYEGLKDILIYEDSEITITINPNGNVKGSVSVDILQI
ncbi:MAG: hypothetical protein K5790_08335 [Nitrosopumilus sp.]|uniref:hypothetical protein n=1 Tax=Nitrosopumilus sp. TaxID=2024843 RepID=UPI00247E2CB1|nr:hypothetical protein [Nitrosopumilus sp.]MCV0393276.1 hypothetical protein [Nitrosopumilus sp.]